MNFFLKVNKSLSNREKYLPSGKIVRHGGQDVSLKGRCL